MNSLTLLRLLGQICFLFMSSSKSGRNLQKLVYVYIVYRFLSQFNLKPSICFIVLYRFILNSIFLFTPFLMFLHLMQSISSRLCVDRCKAHKIKTSKKEMSHFTKLSLIAKKQLWLYLISYHSISIVLLDQISDLGKKSISVHTFHNPFFTL